MPLNVTQRNRQSGSRAWLGRFIRYATGSAGAVLASALAFALAYRLLELGPRIASVTAFLAGALVNFSASRFWAWDRRDRLGLGRDVVSYAVIAVAIAGAAALVTSMADGQLAGVDPDRRAVLVEASYFATYAAAFLVRFVLLDRVVFRSRHQVPSTTRAYRAP